MAGSPFSAITSGRGLDESPQGSGHRAAEISDSVEAAVRSGALGPGDLLPPVRRLADRLGVSPTTIASAYRGLRLRGVVTAAGRRGTRIAERPPIAAPIPAIVNTDLLKNCGLRFRRRRHDGHPR